MLLIYIFIDTIDYCQNGQCMFYGDTASDALVVYSTQLT